MSPRFRSKTLKEIYRQGAAQDFEPGFHRGSGHYFLRCRVEGCGYTHTLSATLNDANRQKVQNIITELRRHGFVWGGRGGEHIAPLLHETLRREREAS